jgi:hypothetical protein
MDPEKFVDAATAAMFLSIRPRRVLEMARACEIPAHPIGTGARKTWRFRLTELEHWFSEKRGTSATPVGRRASWVR